MQNVARALGLDIGFLFQQQTRFERTLAELQTIDAPLAVYICQARAWSDALVSTRNKLHKDWELPRAIISEVDGRVTVAEPPRIVDRQSSLWMPAASVEQVRR